MCQAALRLDPENEDVLKAFELIQRGPEAYAPKEEEPAREKTPPAEEVDEMETLVRQMATAFEAERAAAPKDKPGPADPVETARRRAQDQLAEEIFRDEEEDEPVGQLSKLERDALIGQGMDFEMRGQLADAITCYEKAVAGGLTLPAVHFTLALLYLNSGEADQAREAFAAAANDPSYRQPSLVALGNA